MINKEGWKGYTLGKIGLEERNGKPTRGYSPMASLGSNFVFRICINWFIPNVVPYFEVENA
jgi:hypothetical protein